MSSPLNPDEINALMGAINEGRVPQGGGSGGTGGARGPVVPYDLTSQDRIIREQMPTLNSMNEHLALTLGNGLSGRTRLSIKATSQPATLMKFVDFSGSIEPQCALCVLSLGKGFGPALVVLKPGVPEALLSAALGDRRKSAAAATDAKREFTTVDQTVLRRLMSTMTDAMREVWTPILPFQPEVLRFETDVRMAAVAAPTEVAIVSNFDISGQHRRPHSTHHSVPGRRAGQSAPLRADHDGFGARTNVLPPRSPASSSTSKSKCAACSAKRSFACRSCSRSKSATS